MNKLVKVTSVCALALSLVIGPPGGMKSSAAANSVGAVVKAKPLYVTPVIKTTQSAAQIPGAFDLSSYFPTPKSQGSQSSCTAWSIAYCKTYQEAREIGWTNVNTNKHFFSPAFIYNSLAKGIDNGLYLADVANFVVTNGCTTENNMPYNASNCSTQPSQAAKDDATRFKGSRAYDMFAGDFNQGIITRDITRIKQSIYNGNPVLIGFDCDNDYQTLTSSNSIYDTLSAGFNAINSGATVSVRPGHANCIVGYDDTKRAFKVINSWGTSWGIGGFGWISYDLFNRYVTFTENNVKYYYYAVGDIIVMEDAQSKPVKVNNASELSSDDVITLNVTRYAPVANYTPDSVWLKYNVAASGSTYTYSPATSKNKSDNYDTQIDTSITDLSYCKFKVTVRSDLYSNYGKVISLTLPGNVYTGFYPNGTGTTYNPSSLYFGYNSTSKLFQFNSNTSVFRQNGLWVLGGQDIFSMLIPQTNNAPLKLVLNANNYLSLVYATAYGGDNFTIRKY